MRVVGNLCSQLLIEFSALSSPTALLARVHSFFCFCCLCVSHGDSFTDSGKSNDVTPTLFVTYTCSSFSQPLIIHTVWTFCDTMRTMRYECGRSATPPNSVLLHHVTFTNSATNHLITLLFVFFCAHFSWRLVYGSLI